MEHLFKLKKDGKMVGYSHINGYGQLMFRFPKDDDWYCKDKFWEMMRKKHGFGIPPCSYFPFVTKDKYGKDVFAGDTVKAGNWYFKVIWQKYGYGLKGKKSGWWRQFHEFENIKLIEEKEE